MKKNSIFIFLFTFSLIRLAAQEVKYFKYNENDFTPKITSVINDSARTGIPTATLIWDKNLRKSDSGTYNFRAKPPIQFPSFSFGWKASNSNLNASDFKIKYRYRKTDQEWTQYFSSEGYTKITYESSTIYRSNVIFTNYLILNDEFEIIIIPPPNITIEYVNILIIQVVDDSNKH